MVPTARDPARTFTAPSRSHTGGASAPTCIYRPGGIQDDICDPRQRKVQIRPGRHGSLHKIYCLVRTNEQRDGLARVLIHRNTGVLDLPETMRSDQGLGFERGVIHQLETNGGVPRKPRHPVQTARKLLDVARDVGYTCCYQAAEPGVSLTACTARSQIHRAARWLTKRRSSSCSVSKLEYQSP